MATRSRQTNDPQGGGGDGGGDGGDPPQGVAAVAEAPDSQQLILTALQATNTAIAGLGVALQNRPADMVATAIPAPAPPTPAAPAAPAAVPPEAVRSPFRAAGANVLDFHSKDGKKFYDQATCSLFSSDELFEVEPERL